MTINHPRLSAVLDAATVWEPGESCGRTVHIGFEPIGNGWIGIDEGAGEFREELARILLELDLIALGSTGEGLQKLWQAVGDGSKFLRLWVLAQELQIFPPANCILLMDLYESLQRSGLILKPSSLAGRS